jgi:hypothetical protein
MPFGSRTVAAERLDVTMAPVAVTLPAAGSYRVAVPAGAVSRTRPFRSRVAVWALIVAPAGVKLPRAPSTVTVAVAVVVPKALVALRA